MNTEQHPDIIYPRGRLASSCLLFGGLSLALACALHSLGLFEPGDIWLQQFLSWMFSETLRTLVPDHLLFMVAAIFSFGIVFAVLDSPATWQRLVIGVIALVVVLTVVPACALWQLYFSPFLVGVAFFWAWFCAMMYAGQHTMPCELVPTHHIEEPQYIDNPDNVVAIGAGTRANVVKEDRGRDNQRKAEETDPNAKYQPKEQINDG